MKKLVCIVFCLIFLVAIIGCSKNNDETSSSYIESSKKSSVSSSTSTTINPNSISTENNSSSKENSSANSLVASSVVSSANNSVNENPSSGYAYITDNGVSYNAIGFNNQSNNQFTFSSSLALEFSNKLSSSFNRFSLGYYSSKPLKISVSYLINGVKSTDDYFLEAGEKSFNALIGGYLDGKVGNNFSNITIQAVENGSATFSIKSISTEKIDSLAGDIYYLENTRFKVGIRLSWGGGICYYEDKTFNVSNLSNLINQADTGRLVQQSYYGTYSNGSYVSSSYNGSTWPYNPVQGGDVNGNRSRLIDISIEQNVVKVKAQPQDWAKNNQLTPSYMENVYTLTNDYLKVYNRFIDFSNWEHRYADQELPAFYVVSYLNEFNYYDGSNSWTNDTITTDKNLPFWGDSNNRSTCLKFVKNSNTETWCSWTNSTSKVGIGLFVPNVDSFFAGRHEYSGTTDSLNGACNYVAPVNTIKLQSFQAIEYSYLITSGTNEQMRNVFYNNRTFATNEDLHKNYQSKRVSDEDLGDSLNFTTESSLSYFTQTNSTTISFDNNEKAVKLTSTGVDSYVTLDFTSLKTPLVANNYSTLQIEYKIPLSNSLSSYQSDLFFCCGSTLNPDGNMRERVNLIKDGAYHTSHINVKSLSYFSGNINKIRFDYFDQSQSADYIFVKAIKFVK